MNLVGKLWNRFQAFPEYKGLISNIDALQNQKGNILTALQKAFGTALSDYSNQQSQQLRDDLLKIQEVCRNEITVLRSLLSSTTSFPTDMKQINDFHEDIVKKRKDLKMLQDNYDLAEKEVKDSLAEVEKARQSSNPVIKSRAQEKYDASCVSKQRAFEELEAKRTEVAGYEKEYRKTIMQIIINAFEGYATANIKAMADFGKIGADMKEAADAIQPFIDPSIHELELRLQMLEEENLE